MNRDEVLNLAKECGFHELDGLLDDDTPSSYYDAWPEQVERFAAAMYVKGAEDMRERAAKACEQVDLHSGDHLKHSDPRATCSKAIRSIPTTNTEGE